MRFSLRSLHFYFFNSVANPARSPSRRVFSMMAHSRRDLFDYTSGRWIINDTLRHAERRRVFNVDGLCRLAAQSVDRSADDVTGLEKLAEGGSNRTFLITMRDGFQMVARIPYPVTVPKHFAVASEVATMSLLRSSGLPIPQVYGYSSVPDNAAETEYIFMEFIRGIKLSNIWFELGEGEIISVLRQLVEFESKMMSIAFPAGGSLYYSKDLLKMTGRAGTPLEDARFCIGPDTRLPLWFGRRSQLDVDRGPYGSAEAVLVEAAHKELAYLEQFGCPLLPFNRVRREGYQYQEQLPLDHIENLHRYLLIAPSLISKKFDSFCIRHPDLQPSNIIVTRSSDSNLRVIGLLDWQHTSILPLFLLASIPDRFQNYDDNVSESMMRPVLPENLDDLDETEQSFEKESYRRRLVHYHYVKITEECNALHYAALTEPMDVLRRRLFIHASNPWEGETLALKVALIETTKKWEALTGGGVPCPVMFDAEDVHKTMELDEVQRRAEETLEMFRRLVNYGPEGWVPTKYYEETMERSKQFKKVALEQSESDEERAELMEHWPLDDMDETKYM